MFMLQPLYVEIKDNSVCILMKGTMYQTSMKPMQASPDMADRNNRRGYKLVYREIYYHRVV